MRRGRNRPEALKSATSFREPSKRHVVLDNARRASRTLRAQTASTVLIITYPARVEP